MTLITFQDGKPVLRDGQVGTEQACCCCDPNCLTLSSVFDKSTGSSGCANLAQQNEDSINDEIDFDILLMQTLADNLSALGWTASVEVVERNVSTIFIDCLLPEFAGCPDDECYATSANWIIRLTASCSCCLNLPELDLQNCAFGGMPQLVQCELLDQPAGLWADVSPHAVAPPNTFPIMPAVWFGPTCAPWYPMQAPYGINGEYGDQTFGAIFVPVCTDSEWCENPLP